jgi:hypothetical protein
MAPSELPDDVLSACAAGELSPTEAEAARARAASDPALSARLAAAERVERALRADDLLPVPLALLATILERVHAEPPLGTGFTEPGAHEVAASLAAPVPPASLVADPVASRWRGAIAAAILVSWGSSPRPPASSRRFALAAGRGAPASGSASLGGGLPSPIARTYDERCVARLAPAPRLDADALRAVDRRRARVAHRCGRARPSLPPPRSGHRLPRDRLPRTA